MKNAALLIFALVIGVIIVLVAPWKDDPNPELDRLKAEADSARAVALEADERADSVQVALRHLSERFADSIVTLRRTRVEIQRVERERRQAVDSLIATLPEKVRDEIQLAMDAERHSWAQERENLLQEIDTRQQLESDLRAALEVERGARTEWRRTAERYRQLAEEERAARIQAQRESKVVKVVAGVVTVASFVLGLVVR